MFLHHIKTTCLTSPFYPRSRNINNTLTELDFCPVWTRQIPKLNWFDCSWHSVCVCVSTNHFIKLCPNRPVVHTTHPPTPQTISHTEAAFTQKRFQSKMNTFLSVLAFCLHQNNENTYPKRRPASGDLSGDLENGGTKKLSYTLV